MDTEPLPRQARDYLRKLDRSLKDLSKDERQIAADEVAAQIVGGLERGSKITEVMRELDDVDTYAKRYRAEARRAAAADLGSLRKAGMLHLMAAIVALLGGMFVALRMPSFMLEIADSTGSTTTEVRTIAQEYGVGAVLLALVPAVLAALPLIVPLKWRTPIAIANASLMTVIAGLAAFSIGMFVMPLAVLMWAAVIVPWQMRRGFSFANSIRSRLIFGALIALPGLLIAYNAFTGSFILDTMGWLVVAIPLVLGTLFAYGMRAAALITGIIGFVAIGYTIVFPGLLMLATWWIGGLYISFGFGAYVAWGEKKEAPEV